MCDVMKRYDKTRWKRIRMWCESKKVGDITVRINYLLAQIAVSKKQGCGDISLTFCVGHDLKYKRMRHIAKTLFLYMLHLRKVANESYNRAKWNSDTYNIYKGFCWFVNIDGKYIYTENDRLLFSYTYNRDVTERTKKRKAKELVEYLTHIVENDKEDSFSNYG